MNNILAAARSIASARRNRVPSPSPSSDVGPQDEAEGYRIQRAVARFLLPHFGAMVGYKIGCTSAVMQQYSNIPHPCGGGVFARGVHESGASLRPSDYVRVGVECEIAVRSGAIWRRRKRRSPRIMRDTSTPITPRSRSSTIATSKWETMGAPSLVADDFFAAGCVLGKPVARARARSARGRRPRYHQWR